MFHQDGAPLVVRLAPALLLLLASAAADASPIRVDFEGSTTYADPDSPLPAGGRFTGTLVYDDALPLSRVERDTSGAIYMGYSQSGTHRADDPTPDGTGLTLAFKDPGGEKVEVPDSGGLSMSYHAITGAEGRYGNLTFAGRLPAFEPGVLLRFTTLDSPLLAGGTLPANMKLGDFWKVSVLMESVAGGDVISHPLLFEGVVDSMTVTAVPEPTWTVAALMAASAWVVRRRRRGDRRPR